MAIIYCFLCAAASVFLRPHYVCSHETCLTEEWWMAFDTKCMCRNVARTNNTAPAGIGKFESLMSGYAHAALRSITCPLGVIDYKNKIIGIGTAIYTLLHLNIEAVLWLRKGAGIAEFLSVTTVHKNCMYEAVLKAEPGRGNSLGLQCKRSSWKCILALADISISKQRA